MKFPAQTQDTHAERHIRQLLCSYRPGQHDQEAVDNHSHRNTDEESDLIIAGHFIDQRINQECDRAHDSRADTRKQEGGPYLLAVMQGFADSMPV